MKLQSFAMVILLVLGCSAAFGQTYTFGFADSQGNVACDFVTFTVSAPFAVGTHNYTQFCGDSNDGVLLGFSGRLPRRILEGPVVMMADNSEDAISGYYTGCQLEFVSRLKASSKKIGWVWYVSCGDEEEFILNYGYLSNQLPNSGGRRTLDPGAVVANKRR